MKNKKVVYFIIPVLVIIGIGIISLLIHWYWGNISYHIGRWYRDSILIQWIGIATNLLVVLIALFLNIFLENYRRPKFQIDCGISIPFQKATRLKNCEDVCLMHLRLRIRNVGRTSENLTEVRIEEIYRLPVNKSNKSEKDEDHDPRPLKWVGRSSISPIILNKGAFDFVDLGVRRSDIPYRFFIDFGDRGHKNLDIEENIICGFRIIGTVYGQNAKPKRFEFNMKWDPSSDFGPIQMEKIK